MTVIAEWPVVVRDRIVHAFRPGGSSAAEAPFRTLRRHAWVSSGVRVSRRADRGLAGQMTVFSSLNVDSARLARRGKELAAEQVAGWAADLESGPEFTMLRWLLSGLPAETAKRVVDGVLPDDASAGLADALRALAGRTEQVRASDVFPSSPMEVLFAGRVAEVYEGYVVLEHAEGRATVVPRWMAGAARRDRVGEYLALVTDKIDPVSAVVEAVPAIDIQYPTETLDIRYPPESVESRFPSEIDKFSAYGRGDARVRSITAADARLLAGKPQPLRILVPVTIDG